MKVVHVVLVRWSSAAQDQQKAAIAAAARDLAALIPGIESIAEGPSISPEQLERGHEYALVVTFSSVEARDTYLTHPDHRAFASLFEGAVECVTVYDLSQDVG